MQLIVPGVVMDGSAPPGVNAAARLDVVVYQGQDTVFLVTVTGQNGGMLNLTGYSSALRVKDRVLPATGQPKWDKTYAGDMTNAAVGQIKFTVPGTDLKAMLLQSYYWDVFVTSAGGARDEVVPTGLMTVWAAVGA